MGKIMYKDHEYSGIKDNTYLWKTLSRTGISHPSGANYWGIDTFPAKAGYTRKVGFCSSSNSSVAIVGYYFNEDTVILRTYNMSNSTVSVDLVCTAVYIRDDLAWSQADENKILKGGK